MANNLKLEVILQAFDRATAPIRAVTRSSTGMGRALKESRDQLKALQAQQKDISSLRTQREAVRQTSEKLAGAQQRLRQFREQLQGMDAPSARFQKSFAAAAAQVDKLKAKHGEQRAELQRLVGQLGKAGISTSNLGQREGELRQRIAQANQAIGNQEARLRRLGAQQRRVAAAKQAFEKSQGLAGSMAANGAGAAAAGAAMGAPILGAANSYIDFEDAMLGVAKQVDGARDDNGQLTATYYDMGNAIKAMAERIPMATTEIAALVEGGARMGIQGKDNLLVFAETAANAATAFELPADEIGENLARIANLYKLPIKNVGELGDAINYLDDNAQSKGSDIIDVLQRTAGITTSVGMSFKDAAALGSTFLSLGSSAEVAATATNAMIRELAIANEQPKRFQKGLKALGLQADAIQKGMAKNSTATLQMVLESIKRLPQAEQLSATTQLFGKEFGDDAAKLANNLGEYRRQLQLANSEAGKGSMQREADIRAEALSARLQMAKNRTFNLSASMGETLRPTIISLVESFNQLLAKVSAWVKENPELTGQILRVVAGVAALAAGFGAVTLAMGSFLGPFAMVRYGLTLFGLQGASLAGSLLNLGRNALPLVLRGVLLIGRALMLNPIGLAVTAIAGAAYLIYKNWAPIKAFFLGLWEEVKAGFNGGFAGIGKLIMDFSPLGLFYRAFAAVMGYFGVELPGKFSAFGGMLLDGLVNGIRNKLGDVKKAISAVGDNTVGWFKQKLGIHSPSRVFAELGGFTMSGLEQGLADGQKGPLSAVLELAKQLATAGALTIGASGSALALDSRPPLAPAETSARPVAAQPATIIIQVQAAPGMNEQQLARLVAAEVAKLDNRRQVNARSRITDKE
ncbi:phage tail tape measure protein [Pseudomonas aeruginosa]|uniref:phage tail tape measure protein n=1 Tax=Pseudomonas aeruginosa TaxID=287 RepID=UPI003EE1589D